MKRSVSLLVVLAMIVTTFAGFATVAAQDEFVINFDAAFGIGAIAATPTAQEHTFFYTKGASATAGGWFGGAFPDGTTMVYTVNGGAEQAAGTSNAEPAVQGAVKATVPDATVFYRFSMDLTQTLNDTYQDGQEQSVEIFAKKPDGDRILLATFRTDLSKKVSLDKALFYEGDPITVTYNNADAENNDWLCIYKEPEEGQEYGPQPNDYVSEQYAYVDGSGKIVFNDPQNAVEGNDRTAVPIGQDDYSQNIIVYNKESISMLAPGKYHAVILGGESWYDVECEKVEFEVIAKDLITAENGDYTVNLSLLEGVSSNWASHGYPDRTMRNLGYNNSWPIGLFDLTGFEAVEVTYATDMNFKAKQASMTLTSCFALMSENVTIGCADQPAYSNPDKIIALANCTDASVLNPDAAGWAQGERTAVIDVSESTYQGPIALSHFNSTGNEALVVGIKFIAKKAPVEKTISMEKTAYEVGEPIRISYTGADRANADWLCIYAGADSTYGEPDGPISVQYAYIGGDGTIVFNDPQNQVEGNDRTATSSELDTAYNETDKIFFQVGKDTPLPVLPEGTYHAVILGGESWYNVESEKIVFTVEDTSAKPGFALENTEGTIGDTVEVVLTLNNNPGISYFKVQIGYDAQKLAFKEIKTNTNFSLTPGNPEKNPYSVVFAAAGGMNQNPPVNGEVCVLVFDILDKTSSIGTSALDLIVVEVNSSDTPGEIITITDQFIGTDGSVEIKDVDCEHDFTITKVDDNQHKKVCSICEREYFEAHAWDEGKVTKEPSCTEAGVKTYSCPVCGGTKTETIAALEHDWDAGTVTKEPSCTEAGVKTYSCSRCEETKTEEIAALEHDWDEGTVTKEPSCTEVGEKTYSCSRCEETKTEEIAALEHDWDEGTVTKEPSCTEVGEKTYSCSRCEETKTEEIAALGHSFTNYVYNNDATTAKDGTETAECDHGCGATDTRTKEGTKLPDENPPTGDSGWWIAGIAIAAAAGTVALLFYRKKAIG